MKKFLSVFIAILMVTCLSTTVFAAETIDEAGGDVAVDVMATYSSGGTASTVYSVDVAWGSMEFTYNDASPGTWNPANHQYEGASTASWTYAENANKITVTNHSNTAVTATLSYTKETGFDGITGSFSKSTINLATAVGVLPVNAPTDSSLLTLEGALGSGTATKTVIGSITVTLGGIS